MIKKTQMVVATVVLGIGLLTGCGEDDFSGTCSLCVNGTPVGPSADEQACELWGDAFGCSEAVLTNAGMCGDTAATCSVSDCATGVRACLPTD